ncbi:MAG: B12-binding domain-containing radical SAM protein [Myxococcota bacterium]|nr:B12-binding domain-containing radical SAM protein [Myxococcota bacterium]
MKNKREKGSRKRILLTSVFGPYGVDDAYGRKENIMELYHNQVTKAQGIASLRFHHRSFGLYFIASNVDADVTVLDFPSKARFVREIKKQYDIVGVSFIVPNFLKAKEMARLTRVHAAGSTILLGGHGAAIEGVKDLIDCDHVVQGEGIRWLRTYLGQDPNAPIVHPVLPSTERQSIFGAPVPGTCASMLVTGVGCVNACSFCCTSHFFGRKYTSFISSGRELFETAQRIADARGTDNFFVMDENFLKDKQRALDLIAEMEREKRFFGFHIFSSAEALTAFGIDNLVRLGAQFVWIGFESRSHQERFVKNKGIDAKQLVKDLRDRGISVLASGILCMEHHTPDNMQEDIDFLVDLNADMVQFMLLTPMPVTALYEEHKARKTFREDVAWEDTHGQKCLNYTHPAFADGEPEKWLNAAFRQDFEVNSSSLYRIVETCFRGYKALCAAPELDTCLETRKAELAQRTKEYGMVLPVIAKYAVNDKERHRARALDEEIAAHLGPPTVKERASRVALSLLAGLWKQRVRLFGDMIQPATIVTKFSPEERMRSELSAPILGTGASIIEDIAPSKAVAAMVGTDRST